MENNDIIEIDFPFENREEADRSLIECLSGLLKNDLPLKSKK